MVINVHNGEEPDFTPGETASGVHAKRGCGDGGTCSTGTCGNGLEKVYPSAAVRYGYMRAVGEFRYPNREMRFGCGANVVIQTNRGIELGEMVSLTCDGCDKCVSREQIQAYVEASGPEYYNFNNGRILRLATPEDVADWEHIRAETLKKRKFCQQRALEVGLDMKILDAEHLFGGERIIFYFRSEGRIDFRNLVKELADEYQTRIEMRQIGARDEARLLADYETCGRECCCKNFLKQLKPVNMKMAKMQKATLDPAKVSGRCGRLKCCLRYEHVAYEDLDRQLPRHGTRVFTPEGTGMVVDRQILTQLLQVETEDGGRFTVAREALLDQAEFMRLLASKEKPAPVAERPRRPERPERGERPARVENRQTPPPAPAPQNREETPAADPDEAAGKPEGRSRPRRGRRGRRRGEAPNQSGPVADGTLGALDSTSSTERPASADTPGNTVPREEDSPSDEERRPGSGRRRRRGRRGPRGGGPRQSPPDAGGPPGES
jgi:cell fate regulator YaaT (PSP1 superfamily)